MITQKYPNVTVFNDLSTSVFRISKLYSIYNHLFHMSMYKGLIVVVALLLIGGAGYYFKQVGVPDLVVQDINREGTRGGYGVSALEVYSGEYECVENTGCKNKTRIVLGQDTTFDIVATVDGEEVSLGQGTWGIGTNGSLVIVLQNTDPNSLIAKKISTLRISGFSEKKGLFPGMKDPTFTRVKSTNTSSPTGSN
jgi:hypothetical protein